jgi:hypothetical protein
MGSPADSAISEEIKKHCEKLLLSVVRRVMSAHKVTEETLKTVQYVSSIERQLVFITLITSPVVCRYCFQETNEKSNLFDVSSAQYMNGFSCFILIIAKVESKPLKTGRNARDIPVHMLVLQRK